MFRNSQSPRELVLRPLLALVATIWLWGTAMETPDALARIALVLLGIVVQVVLLMPYVLTWIGNGTLALALSERFDPKAAAPVARVDALIARERWFEADLELERLARAHPEDSRLWSRRFEITWVAMGDRAVAREAFVEAWGRTPGDRREDLLQAYQVQAARALDDDELEVERVWLNETTGIRRPLLGTLRAR